MASPCSGETLPGWGRAPNTSPAVTSKPPTPALTSKPPSKARKIRPVFSVRVSNQDGKITMKKGDKPWKTLDTAWWTYKHPEWLRAVDKFVGEHGLVPSRSNELAAILMPKPTVENHNLARKSVYRKLAKWAGFSDREPLPDYIMAAVRNVYPDPNDEYMGFRQA